MDPRLQAIMKSFGVPGFLWNRVNSALRTTYHQMGDAAFRKMMTDGCDAIQAEEGTAVQDLLQQNYSSPSNPPAGQG